MCIYTHACVYVFSVIYNHIHVCLHVYTHICTCIYKNWKEYMEKFNWIYLKLLKVAGSFWGKELSTLFFKKLLILYWRIAY